MYAPVQFLIVISIYLKESSLWMQPNNVCSLCSCKPLLLSALPSTRDLFYFKKELVPFAVADALYFALFWRSSVGCYITNVCSLYTRKLLQFCTPLAHGLFSLWNSNRCHSWWSVPSTYALLVFVCGSLKLSLHQERGDKAADRLDTQMYHESFF